MNTIRTAEDLHRLVTTFVKQRGLPSTTALIVLEVLRGAGEALQPSVIAARSFLSRPAMSSALTTLEQRGLVLRAAHPTDRRLGLVSITPAGLTLMEDLLPALHRAEAQWIDPVLTSGQQDQLLALLGLLQAKVPRS